MLAAFALGLLVNVPPEPAHCRADLVVDRAAAVAGRPFHVGVRFKIDPEWHIYWRNPGDSGAETNIKWTLPKGWTAGPLIWPKPKIHEQSGIVTYVYEKEVVLVSLIQPKEQAAGQSIKAEAEWLVCQEACIPGRATLNQKLSAATPDGAEAIVNALKSAPKKVETASAELNGTWVDIPFRNPSGIIGWKFLPYDSGLIENGKPGKLRIDKPFSQISYPKSSYFDPKLKRVRGALASSRDYFEIDVPLQTN